MKILRYGFFVLFIGYIIVLGGCATIKETALGAAGISTKVLEDGRVNAIAKNFNFDYFTGYTKSLDALKEMGAYIYNQSLKEHMIAVYVSKSDTTPVGLFFKEVERNITRVEVSSPSSYAKEMIAEKLFSKLDKQLAVGEELDKKQ